VSRHGVVEAVDAHFVPTLKEGNMKMLKSWLVLLCLCGASAAQALTLTGTTSVELTAAGLLASNGVAVQPVGTAH